MKSRHHIRTLATITTLALVTYPVVTNAAERDREIPGVQQSPRGEDWTDDSEDAVSLEELRQIREREDRAKREEAERRYQKRLKDLGVGKYSQNNSGSGSSGSSGSSSSGSSDSSSGSSDSSSSDGSSDAEPPASSGDMAEPIAQSLENISSGYKSPDRPGHRGVDIAKPEGDHIYAMADGVVVQSGPADGFGNWIVIDHTIDGKTYSTVYGHMWDGDLHVNVGDEVKAGQHIADEGSNGQSSGPHLHFEVWENGRINGGNEVDPTPWIKRSRGE